jgi:hypothetical protein
MNVFDLLQKVYGARGLPFPSPPKKGEGSAIGGAFGKPLTGEGTAIAQVGTYASPTVKEMATTGSLIRKYDDSYLGSYQFLPASINGIDMPNAVVIITGEKHIEETDIVDVGTVFEKVFTRPYSITIICTIIGNNGNWPELEIQAIRDLWRLDEPVTLRCALTDQFLAQKKADGKWYDTPTNNFIIKNIAVLDNQGAENVEVIQIDGMSNIEFELELL